MDNDLIIKMIKLINLGCEVKNELQEQLEVLSPDSTRGDKLSLINIILCDMTVEIAYYLFMVKPPFLDELILQFGATMDRLIDKQKEIKTDISCFELAIDIADMSQKEIEKLFKNKEKD